jgi:hypothetical protein
MLSPIAATNVRVEEQDRKNQSHQRPQKRKKDKPQPQTHEENRGDRIDLTA